MSKRKSDCPYTEAFLKELDAVTQDRMESCFMVSEMANHERALYLLLDGFRDRIPSVKEYDPTSFHKAFRQIDVTINGAVDMAIYLLMQTRASVIVLDLVEKHHKIANEGLTAPQ